MGKGRTPIDLGDSVHAFEDLRERFADRDPQSPITVEDALAIIALMEALDGDCVHEDFIVPFDPEFHRIKADLIFLFETIRRFDIRLGALEAESRYPDSTREFEVSIGKSTRELKGNQHEII